MAERVWTIPDKRMKAGREHRVPLTDRAIEIIEIQSSRRERKYVFPGGRFGEPLGSNSLWKFMGELGRRVSVHGFRSSFRTWAAEQTTFPAEIAEMRLGHIVGTAVERAY